MKKKNVKTASTEVAPEENSNYGQPIYLTLNGNNWEANTYYLINAIHEAHEYNSPLYVTTNVGGPPNPPPCPPAFPNCHGNP